MTEENICAGDVAEDCRPAARDVALHGRPVIAVVSLLPTNCCH